MWTHNDLFESIHELYVNQTFCDVKIVAARAPDEATDLFDSNVTEGPVFCHALVLCGVLPELRKVLESQEQCLDSELILVLEGISRGQVKNLIDNIYSCLASFSASGDEIDRQKLLQTFSLSSSESILRPQSAENDVKPELDVPDYLGGDDIKTHALGDPLFMPDVDMKELEVSQPSGEIKKVAETSSEDSDYFGDEEVKVKPTSVLDDEDRKRKVRVKLLEQYCPYCLQSFPTISNKDRAEFMEHKRTHFVCECKIQFKYFKAYEDHMSQKHNVSIYRCDQPGCSSYYRRLQDLNNHKISRHIHDKEESNVCPICGRIFNSAYYMRSHYVSIHTKMKCKICGHVSNGSNGNQKHHMDFHQSPIVCDQCGKTFKRKKNLRIHIINVHTADKDRPFRCKLCPRGFLDNTKLYDHVARDHEGRRQYPCRSAGCAQAFTLPGVRKKHEKRAHKLTIDLRKGSRSKAEITPGFHPNKELEMKPVELYTLQPQDLVSTLQTPLPPQQLMLSQSFN